MAEIFPSMGVAEMKFHVGDRNACKGIADRDGGMGVSPGVDQDSVATPHRLVNAIHKGAFEIALEASELHRFMLGLTRQ